jgi:hypothetical protein
MNILKKAVPASCLLLICISAFSQSKLSAGFNPDEYLQLLEIFNAQTSHLYKPLEQNQSEAKEGLTSLPAIPKPENYTMVYESPVVGLDNRWALWLKKDSSVAVISIRGTTTKTESWLENFYAAMLPAGGSLKVNDTTTFTYKLAENPDATVHTGWLIGLASLAPTILQEIKKYDSLGVKQFIIFGHSQGGALAFLTRSYLHYLPDSILPKDIVYKTYCSAAPKPGNLYYAYDFDYITRGRWAFRIVNEKDWVPETPFSIQTLQDFNEVNPFIHIKPALKKTGFLVRLYAMHIFNKLDRSSEKANKRFRKVLGKTLYKMVHKNLPPFPEPEYAHSMNYMPAGTPIILMPYKNYDTDFPYNGKNVFIHHGLEAYYLLTLHQYINLHPYNK